MNRPAVDKYVFPQLSNASIRPSPHSRRIFTQHPDDAR
jgi:hypothetical protein